MYLFTGIIKYSMIQCPKTDINIRATIPLMKCLSYHSEIGNEHYYSPIVQ